MTLGPRRSASEQLLERGVDELVDDGVPAGEVAVNAHRCRRADLLRVREPGGRLAVVSLHRPSGSFVRCITDSLDETVSGGFQCCRMALSGSPPVVTEGFFADLQPVVAVTLSSEGPALAPDVVEELEHSNAVFVGDVRDLEVSLCSVGTLTVLLGHDG